MQEITKGVFVESRFAPYNVAILDLPEGALAIDVPPRPSAAQQWLLEAQEAVGAIRYLVVTDATVDRIIGAALWNVPIIAAGYTAHYLASVGEKEWQDILQVAQERYSDDVDALIGLKIRRARVTSQNRILLHYTSPPLEVDPSAGSSPGSLSVYSPAHGVLLGGDTVILDEPPILENTRSVTAWLGTLATFEERTAVKWIIPGRGLPSARRSDLETQREFIGTLVNAARRLARNAEPGSGVAQAAQELQQAFFPMATKHSEAAQRIRRGLEHLTGVFKSAE